MGKWSLKSRLEDWVGVSAQLESELENHGFSPGFSTALMLAADEVFANISMYAYNDCVGDVEICSKYEITSDIMKASISFCDSGKPFNPLEYEKQPDTNKTVAAEMKIGGLGIFLVKKQTDELRYEYVNETNNLTLIKHEMNFQEVNNVNS